MTVRGIILGLLWIVQGAIYYFLTGLHPKTHMIFSG